MKLTSKKKTFKNFDKGPVIRQEFNNGSVFLYHKFAGLSRACFSITFAVGSIHEDKNEYGIAHLLEHLIFKSARNNRLFGNIIETIEELGGDLNGYTSKEHISFELTCIKTRLSEILPWFFKLFTHFEISDKDYLNEREVVLKEIKEDNNDVELFAEEYLIEHNFKDEFSHPIAGNEKTLKKIKFDQVNRFYTKFFVPERMVITLVSDDHDLNIKQLIKDYFSIENKAFKVKKPERYKFKPQFKAINKINKKFKKNVEYPYVLYGFSAPSMFSNEKWKLYIIDQILNEGLNSLLFKSLREENSLSYGISSSINSFFNQGHYLLDMNVEACKVDELDKVIMNTFKTKLDKFLTEEVINQNKRKILDTWQLLFDDAEERLEYLVKTELFLKDFSGLAQIKEMMNEINVGSIKKFRDKMLNMGVSRLVILPKN
jgi:predicted Zn-dependent peptidase